MASPDLTHVRRAARRRVAAEQGFRDAVIAAHREGRSLRQIADAAGLSHVRVLTIVREGANDGG